MEDVTGKTAFITGGAGGIGLAMAHVFAEAGMNVAILDIEAEALTRAEESLSETNTGVVAIRADVTDREAFADAADKAEARFGPVHVVCNNAGVVNFGRLDEVSYADYDWVLGVNIGGVVNGLQTFLPRMQAHGEGGHIVNTSSIAGHLSPGNLGIYCASKYAVLALSESLAGELAGSNIGVSVLCPAAVATGIVDSDRNRFALARRGPHLLLMRPRGRPAMRP